MQTRYPGMIILLIATAAAHAETTQLRCDMQVEFRKPWYGNTEWVHAEGKVTKYFTIDRATRQVTVYNARTDTFDAVCSAGNTGCNASWTDSAIDVDGTRSPDQPAPPYLDFRRAFSLTQTDMHARLIIADFGANTSQRANMRWIYDGHCESVQARPVRSPPPGARSTTFRDRLTLPVSRAESRKVFANRVGNTMTGLSAGGRSWFHMWIFDADGLSYKGDGTDITSERTTSTLYVGKDVEGSYRMCEQPIAPAGNMGCYPFPVVKVGDSWVEEDVFGTAEFTLLPGRQ